MRQEAGRAGRVLVNRVLDAPARWSTGVVDDRDELRASDAPAGDGQEARSPLSG